MAIRSSLDGLKTILGMDKAVPTSTKTQSATTNSGSLPGNDGTTLSSAGSMVSMLSSGADVRADKVAAIQNAISSGSYSVPASVVASKTVDFMLGSRV